MSATTIYAAEVLDTIAELRNLEQFTRTPIFIHSGVDDELIGWLGCSLPSSGYPCEHMGMGDEGSTACWSATEINRLREENAKLRDLVTYMYRCYVIGHDWGFYGAPEKEHVEATMRELGIEVI